MGSCGLQDGAPEVHAGSGSSGSDLPEVPAPLRISGAPQTRRLWEPVKPSCSYLLRGGSLEAEAELSERGLSRVGSLDPRPAGGHNAAGLRDLRRLLRKDRGARARALPSGILPGSCFFVFWHGATSRAPSARTLDWYGSLPGRLCSPGPSFPGEAS